jgi:hypothetical protein
MSLRDVYFMEFGEDFQGTRAHSAEEDAMATVRCFMEGYVPINLHKIHQSNESHFDDALKLKDQDGKQMFYCNKDRAFKDSKNNKCNCLSCT